MDKQKNTEEILKSLDDCQKAAAPAYFYTRLRARMEGEMEAGVKRGAWFLKPAYAMAVAIAVLVLNAFLLLGRNDNKAVAGSSDTDTFQSLAADYRLNDNNNLYDLTEERQP